ncbi:MAG: amino acid-binding protein [Clostridia bacterium]|nr:amino acid-binding protein [Clostridia bacterium]
MLAKQLSVFIENRKGRLGELLDVLKESGVNILSLSLADTMEYGLLRLIVDDPQKGKESMTAAGCSCMLTEVFIVKIPHSPGSLQKILKTIADEEIGVEYMYGLSYGGDEACIVVKTSDSARAEEVFTKHGIETTSHCKLAF